MRLQNASVYIMDEIHYRMLKFMKEDTMQDFNDTHTHQEVLDLLDKTISALE